MKEAPCPANLCVHQGWIERGSIICLPNKVFVTVGDKEDKEYDAVTR
ncbi:MAG: NusG domain II-containing protein [Nitrospirota bacterium]